MNKIKYLMIVLALMLGSSTFADNTWQIVLVAGQNTTVGNVTIVDSGNTLTVSYAITTPGWCLTTTQLYVGTDVPNNPAPGRFPYKHEGLPCVYNDSYQITGLSGQQIVMAHADVAETRDSTTLPQLSGTVNLTVTHQDNNSYFDSTVSGAINGTYDGWCVDVERAIFSFTPYIANVYSSYDANLPAGLVDRPENLDLINYIINQNYIAWGYTYGDIERAIWTLIDHTVSDAGLGDWSQERVNQIVNDAQAHGEGFIPHCSDLMAVLLQPVNELGQTSAQVTIIEVSPSLFGASCTTTRTGRTETAWALAADGVGFRQGWGTYTTIFVD